MVKKRITKHKKYIIDRKQFIKIIKYLRSGKNIANTQKALEVNEKFNTKDHDLPNEFAGFLITS